MMASLAIHDDQENHVLTIGNRKDNIENAPAANQRRALGDINQAKQHQQRNPTKFTALANHENILANEENKFVRIPNKFDKPVQPPVAQFKAFSVYEDTKVPDIEVKKHEAPKSFSIFEDTQTDYVEKDETDDAQLAVAAKVLSQVVLPERAPLQDKCKDEYLDSPMSVNLDTSSFTLSITKSEKKEELSNEQSYAKAMARTDRELFFHVAEYRQDIYNYMREIEVKHCASPGYMRKQPDISHGMRGILVDWLAEVCEEYRLQAETLHLAVSYVDRFLSYMSVVRAKLQLVGTAATFIASKYEEIYPPDVNEFVYITDDTYSKKQVLRMEHLILKVLSFDLSTPTALAFISHFCISNGLAKKVLHLANYISELSLLEADPYLQFRASVLGAASLATARHCLLCVNCGPHALPTLPARPACLAAAWPHQMVVTSGYEVADLEPCMRELARTHCNAPLQPYKAIIDKYKSNRFESVSTVEARPIYPVPKYQPPPQTHTPSQRQQATVPAPGTSPASAGPPSAVPPTSPEASADAS